jgi:hypothetical protein
MKEYTIIFYRQYGKWSVTVPFDNLRDAERHADFRLRDPNKDYIKDITFHTVELPE